MVRTLGGSLSGSTTVDRVRRGWALASVSYWVLIRLADSSRCALDREVREVEEYFFDALAELRKTKTLEPPVMSLTGTRSWPKAVKAADDTDKIAVSDKVDRRTLNLFNI